MASIGERIKVTRKETSFSQVEFAKAIGVTHGHISKVERGITTPSNQLIRSICTHFGVSYDWLATGTGPKSSDDVSLEDLFDQADKLSRNEALNILDECAELIENVEDKLFFLLSGKGKFSKRDVDAKIVKKRLLRSLVTISSFLASIYREYETDHKDDQNNDQGSETE